MKKLILIASIVIGFTALANAQVIQKSPEQRAAHITKVLQKNLALSESQASKVNDIFLTRASRIDSLRSNPSADKRTNHQIAENIMHTAQQQIFTVLDASQREKFVEWEKMRKERRMQRKQGADQKS